MNKILTIFLIEFIILFSYACSSPKNISGNYQSYSKGSNEIIKLYLRTDSTFLFRYLRDSSTGRYKMNGKHITLLYNHDPFEIVGYNGTIDYPSTEHRSLHPHFLYYKNHKLFKCDSSFNIDRQYYLYKF